MKWYWWVLGIGVALVVVACGAEWLAEARDRARFPPPGRMVDVGGRRLHLLCKRGDIAAGPTVVVEQGAGSPSILWWPVQDKVSAFARVCTYDRAGYQWSDPGPRRRSLADRVADLHAVLTAGGVPGPYVLVAHSFGGPVIRLYAQTYPSLVAGMVLVDTPDEGVIFGPAYQGYAAKLGWAARGLEVAARLGLVRLGLRWMTGVPDGMTPEAFLAFKAMVARPDFFRAMADDTAALFRGPRNFGDTLGTVPLVVIEHGQKFPGPAAALEDGWAEGQKRLAAMSAHGALIVAANSNHMVFSDEPDVVVAAIRRVVEAVRAAGAPPPRVGPPPLPHDPGADAPAAASR